jgi:hypothetical protein
VGLLNRKGSSMPECYGTLRSGISRHQVLEHDSKPHGPDQDSPGQKSKSWYETKSLHIKPLCHDLLFEYLSAAASLVSCSAVLSLFL